MSLNCLSSCRDNPVNSDKNHIVSQDSQDFSDFYDLNFKTVNNWGVTNRHYCSDWDSITPFQGKYPLCIYSACFNGEVVPLVGELYQTIMLPDAKSKGNCEVGITYKCMNKKNVRFQVSAFDRNGTMICSRILHMNKQDKWNKASLQFSDKTAKFLHLRIIFDMKDDDDNPVRDIGIHSWSGDFISECPHDNTDVEKIWIDRIHLKFEDFDMSRFSPEMFPHPSQLDTSKIIPLDINDKQTFHSLSKQSHNKRIFSIGETTHASHELPRIAFQLMKDRIVNNNCKVVAMEISMSMGLKWNRYISGEIPFEEEAITKDLNILNVSKKSCLDFLFWLKKYNEQTNDKVRLFGMDGEVNSLIETYNYQDYFNSYIHIDTLLFSDLFFESLGGYADTLLLKIKEKEEQLLHYIGEQEFGILVKSLQSLKKMPSTLLDMAHYEMVTRDSIMFNNICYAMDNILKPDESLSIFCHFGHAMKGNIPSAKLAPPLGKQLHERFGEQYFTAGLFFSEKEIHVEGTDTISLLESDLLACNIESMAYKTGIPCFYLPTNELIEDIQAFRTSHVMPATSAQNNKIRDRISFAPLSKYTDALIYVDKINMTITGREVKEQSIMDQFRGIMKKTTELKSKKNRK